MCEIKLQVIKIISETLNVEQSVLSDDLSIGDIPEWDSVGNLAIISALEETMDIEIPLDDLFELTSIAALVEEVTKLKS